MLNWLNKITDADKDPVKACEVYTNVGCLHVNSLRCQMDTCFIVVRYNDLKQSIHNDVSNVITTDTGDQS